MALPSAYGLLQSLGLQGNDPFTEDFLNQKGFTVGDSGNGLYLQGDDGTRYDGERLARFATEELPGLIGSQKPIYDIGGRSFVPGNDPSLDAQHGTLADIQKRFGPGHQIQDGKGRWLMSTDIMDTMTKETGQYDDGGFFAADGPFAAFGKTIGPMMGASSLINSLGGFGYQGLGSSLAENAASQGGSLSDIANQFGFGGDASSWGVNPRGSEFSLGTEGAGNGQGIQGLQIPGFNGATTGSVGGLGLSAAGAGSAGLGAAGVAASALGSGAAGGGGFWSDLLKTGKVAGIDVGRAGTALASLFTGMNSASDLERIAREAASRSDPAAHIRPFFQEQTVKSFMDPNYFKDNAVLGGIKRLATDDVTRNMSARGYNMSGNEVQALGSRLQDESMKFAQPMQSMMGQFAGLTANPSYAGMNYGNLAQQGVNQQNQALGNLGILADEVRKGLPDLAKLFGNSGGAGGLV